MTNSTLVAMAQQAKANRQVCINKKKIFKKGQKTCATFKVTHEFYYLLSIETREKRDFYFER